ncbi:PEP-CTERM sorting domain-containing protein [Hahella sp. KA22]|uniref:exosortase-dependent surface protein XDP1 n=1 Tax=Hahella sp. KA22 TaxID=1628392 RepID=UPI000FDDC96C|nr:exosortase-dependent surface protein XDP1 [Hahella sp. KA22]AZZ92684.1 PEP-CTERM sorting domain-containing protein [Hahella sp. KA22]QAY56057.1 PEP-CTERM sorting domain-containing protein [Hahella sp. KA22]
MLKTLTKGLLLSALTASSAYASQITWDLTEGVRYGSYNNSLSYSKDGMSLTVTGWSDTKGPADDKIEGARLGRWNGLGVCNDDEYRKTRCATPEHSTDNDPGRDGDFDMIMLSFSEAVSLSSFQNGWYAYDSDVSLLAYTGGAPSYNLNDKDWEGLLSDGWSVAGNYSNTMTKETATSTDLVSKFWLIGAYNPAFGELGELCNELNDHFKLKMLTIDTVECPEPTALGLFGLSLAGLFAARRRKAS